MRILDFDNDKKIDRITIFFTKDEAIQMIGFLEDGLEIDKPYDWHEHIYNKDYQKEITIALYDENDSKSWSHFDKRSQKLIEEDI